MSDELRNPWEFDDERWRGSQEPVADQPAEQGEFFAATYLACPCTPNAPLIRASVLEDGDLRLTIRRHTDPGHRDYLVVAVLERIDGEATWTRVRRSQGTHAPTVEVWRRSP